MPSAFPPLVRSCLAVLLLVGGLAWWAVGRKSDDLHVASGSTKPKLRDFLAIGMGVLALECGFLWVLSAAPVPLEEVAAKIELKLRPQAALDRAAAATAGRTGSGNWLWQEEGRRALPMRTNLKPGAKPEVFIRLLREEDAQKLLARKTYVRAFALDDYRKGVWSPGNPRDEIVEADGSGWIRFGERLEGEILHEIFHGKDGGGRDAVTALQGLRAVRMPEVRVASDGMVLLPDTGGSDGYGYMAGSFPLALEDLKGEEVSWKATVAPGAGKFSALAAKAAGKGDVLQKLLNIQNFLRSGYRYSLVTENPNDLDPLENFLFGEKRGHCEFFATAGTLLARELGVETRVAYGWAGGEYFKDSLMFVFRAREAHAWVEVNVPGHGWAVMEPTPPVMLSGNGSPRLADSGEKLPSPDVVLSDETKSEVSETGHVERIAFGLTAVFGGVAAFVFLLRGMQKDEGSRGIAGLPGLKREGGYFNLWQIVCARKGMKKSPGMTLKRQLDEMSEPPSFAVELLKYHYSRRYEGSPRDKDSERRLVDEINSWE